MEESKSCRLIMKVKSTIFRQSPLSDLINVSRAYKLKGNRI